MLDQRLAWSCEPLLASVSQSRLCFGGYAFSGCQKPVNGARNIVIRGWATGSALDLAVTFGYIDQLGTQIYRIAILKSRDVFRTMIILACDNRHAQS